MAMQRLVTRSDFDGLVCAILLRELNMIDEIVFVHPKDMQDGKVAITDRDITTNLPYVPGVGMAFDHHSSEILRNPGEHPNLIIHPNAPSAARVVFAHFGSRLRSPESFHFMLEAVDKADSAQFNYDEILHPSRWVLLNFLVDPRTGLGSFRDFRIGNDDLMMALIDYCLDHSIEEILSLPDVKERIGVYLEHLPRAREQIRRGANVQNNLVVVDLRNEKKIWACNRFMIYALFPEINISIHVLRGVNNQNTVFATGKSILNRTSKTDIGALMLEYGGGGHEAAGTCQVSNDEADATLAKLVKIINQDG
ncbi:MAG: exopolyphosphatase [Betaproteobacteria bacterium]|nr:exopolyphosphatase [Betaproteobacteria bacterium]